MVTHSFLLCKSYQIKTKTNKNKNKHEPNNQKQKKDIHAKRKPNKQTKNSHCVSFEKNKNWYGHDVNCPYQWNVYLSRVLSQRQAYTFTHAISIHLCCKTLREKNPYQSTIYYQLQQQGQFLWQISNSISGQYTQQKQPTTHKPFLLQITNSNDWQDNRRSVLY